MNNSEYQTNSSGYTDVDFKNYLNQSINSHTALDLSKSSVLDIINELIKMKSNISPGYSKSFSTLKLHIAGIEFYYKVT